MVGDGSKMQLLLAVAGRLLGFPGLVLGAGGFVAADPWFSRSSQT